MPLSEIRATGSSTVGTWFMAERLEELREMIVLTERERQEFEKFTSQRRKKEFLAVRLLLKAMLGHPAGIIHSPDGKPSLKNLPGHISISHSGTLAAIILSDRSAGIDAEETGRKVSDIARRFLSEKELSWTLQAQDPQLAQIFCWSAKEAVFKMAGDQHLDFRKDVYMEEVALPGSGKARALFTKKGKCTPVDLNFFFTWNNVVTWCVNSLDE